VWACILKNRAIEVFPLLSCSYAKLANSRERWHCERVKKQGEATTETFLVTG